jgi:DNA polymerase type B, organellar and viral
VYTNVILVKLDFGYKTTSQPLINEDLVDDFIQKQREHLLADVENRDMMSSGWSLFAIKHLELRISKYKALRGRSHLKLPKWISGKKATINFKNENDLCFLYCIMSQYLLDRKLKVTLSNITKHRFDLNFGITLPPTAKDISKFCSLNNASVNVIGVAGKNFFPIRISKQVHTFHCNLLYFEVGEKAHYFLITNLSRLLTSQLSMRNGRSFFCLRCFLRFTSQERLDIHIKACGNEQLTTITFPKKKTFYKFDRFDTCQQAGVIGSLDFESFLAPVHSCAPGTSSYSEDVQRHELAAFGLYLHCTINTPDTSIIPSGYFGHVSGDSNELENMLIDHLNKISKASQTYFNSNYPIHMSSYDEDSFQNATECYVCHKPFTEKDIKVRDHQHSIPLNNYRGSCHQSCNLLIRRRKMIPIYCHGLANYDGHYLVRMFAKRKFKMQIIPHNVERYLTIAVWMNGIEIRFLDSVKIFNSSLESVLESLPNEHFILTKLLFPSKTHDLILSKLAFPYSFLSNAESLDYPSFPEKQHFKNDLTNSDISDEMYARAKQLWDGLECSSFRDMVSAYVMADSVQLLDSILYLRDLFYTNFGVELTSFLSLPQASITCMLKLSKVEIQVFDSEMEDMYDMVKRSVYGGLVSCNIRYVEASENAHLNFLDINGLYSNIMVSHKLPVSDYMFVDVHSQNWSTLDTEGQYGYMLEVDLEFPPSTHDYLNCMPPVCERMIPVGSKTPRLISDFSPKTNYVLSLQHLQLLLRLGVHCTKIWLVLRFVQGTYMKEYVEIVAEMRRKATNTCSSNLFKNCCNYLFGKTIQNVLNYKSVEIVVDEKRMEKLVRKGTFKNRYIYNYSDFSMVLVELSKGLVVYDRPLIVGTMILSLSKVYMYRMWYDVLKPNLGVDNTFLINMDTDSILYVCTASDHLQRLASISDYLDCSSLDPSHPLFSTKNKKVLGKMKFETNGRKLVAVCSVKSKVYALLFEDDCVKKLKGVQRHFVKNCLTFQDYKDCVLDGVKRFAMYKAIVSREHVLYTIKQSKLALECTDFKRFILPDRVHTLAYAHYKLSQ